MKVFFETIEKIYYILAGKHSGRMQKYKKITDKEGNTKKVIEKWRNMNKKCWVCNSELRLHDRFVDHDHTSGIANYLNHEIYSNPYLYFCLIEGAIRGVICRYCNASLEVEKLKSLPIFFHNGEVYFIN